MAKDLRKLLEPAQKAGQSAPAAAPLAQRRSLSSPGEPRVFRVRTGFVCGLCGRLHASIEPAFDCLGRCTIELRLRTPAGRSLSGTDGHYACTACGRGFANTDDAEECFERCLAKMKPSSQFEQALRKVQVRYIQRLQAHGLRSLHRIDSFSEHTKMLNTLTQEQIAMGRPLPPAESPAAPPLKSPVAAQTHAQKAATLEKQHASTAQGTMAASPAVAQQVSPIAQQVPSAAQAPAALNMPQQLEPQKDEQTRADALGFSAATELEESGAAEATSVDDLFPEMKAESAPQAEANIEAQAPAGQSSETDVFTNAQPSESQTTDPAADLVAELSSSESASLASENDLAAFDESVESNASQPADPEIESLLNSATFSAEQPATNAASNLEQDFGVANDLPALSDSQSESNSALTLLAVSTPEKSNPKPAPGAAQSSLNSSTKDKDDMSEFSLDLLGGGDAGLSSAFAEASEFAQVAEQPETNVLAADVLALLQTSSSGENLELSKTQQKQLSEKQVKIDTSLLDAMTSKEDDLAKAGTVYVRKADMKSYRRNNAKYCCSACGNEFFTKEQVEACFFSHPEEGSEEARILMERAAKVVGKSAA